MLQQEKEIKSDFIYLPASKIPGYPGFVCYWPSNHNSLWPLTYWLIPGTEIYAWDY